MGSFPPNGYGLYDIGGNVREWCADWYDSGSSYYSKSPEGNPLGPNTGSVRVVRGGGFGNTPMDRMRVADRDYLNPEWFKPDLGFRCVIGVSP